MVVDQCLAVQLLQVPRPVNAATQASMSAQSIHIWPPSNPSQILAPVHKVHLMITNTYIMAIIIILLNVFLAQARI